jgi:hypothetical protein
MLCGFAMIVVKALMREENRRVNVKHRTLKLLLCNLVCSALTCLWGVVLILLRGVDPFVCAQVGKLGGR